MLHFRRKFSSGVTTWYFPTLHLVVVSPIRKEKKRKRNINNDLAVLPSHDIEMWNMGWTALMVSRRWSVNDYRLGWVIISYGPRYFLESFFNGRVVWKYCDLTNTDCPTWKSGCCCQQELVEGWYCLWTLAISSLSMLCSSSRSTIKSQAREEAISRSRYTLRLGWYPLLAKNGKTPVVVLEALLYANSAKGNSSDQLSCW